MLWHTINTHFHMQYLMLQVCKNFNNDSRHPTFYQFIKHYRSLLNSLISATHVTNPTIYKLLKSYHYHSKNKQVCDTKHIR
jgi:hypothetical protein